MKQIFTLISMWVMAIAVSAADGYVFVDKDGNAVANGSTVVSTAADVDMFGTVMIHSGLFVKNADAPANYSVAVEAKITRMDNGALQLCFPTNCYQYIAVGTYGGDSKTTLDQGQSKDLQTEWLPTAYGECIVEYTAKSYQGVFSKGSCTVTVHYVYADPAGIAAPSATDRRVQQSYDLQGRSVRGDSRGLRLVRMSDGSVKKVNNTK